MAEMITASALKIRLDPHAWPKALDPALPGIANIGAAFRRAQEFSAKFSQVQEANISNKSLSPSGAREATMRWAEGELPALRSRLVDMQTASRVFEEARMVRIVEWLGPAPTEPAGIALQAEIRSWIRSVPITERASKVLSTSEKGDLSALRAVLTAPGYLTGLDADTMTSLRDKLYERNAPEQNEKDQLKRKAFNVAIRAMDGMVRFAEQETQIVQRRAVA
jgi:hypothetical protein